MTCILLAVSRFKLDRVQCLSRKHDARIRNRRHGQQKREREPLVVGTMMMDVVAVTFPQTRLSLASASLFTDLLFICTRHFSDNTYTNQGALRPIPSSSSSPERASPHLYWRRDLVTRGTRPCNRGLLDEVSSNEQCGIEERAFEVKIVRCRKSRRPRAPGDDVTLM
jgi:hypothetical protein